MNKAFNLLYIQWQVIMKIEHIRWLRQIYVFQVVQQLID